jgi:hypothetical protein
VSLIALSATAWGQAETYDDAYLEMLRSDIRTQKTAAITQVLMLSDAESEAFWPVYRQYELELSKIADKRLALIKDYALHYDTLSNVKAGEILKTSFGLQEERLKLQRRYMKEFDKVLPTTTVVRYFQTERMIEELIDLQIMAELPLAMTVRDAVAQKSGGKR